MQQSVSLIKPAEYAENCLIKRILSDEYPIDSHLPAERELAGTLGVTRPTLREALQRLGRDGWLEIRQGKPTRVRNFWQEGSLGVLSALAGRPQALGADFVPHLLAVREALAPAYAAQAVIHQPQAVSDYLTQAAALPDDPLAFAAYDWQLHRQLAILSGNPIFTLILNGFTELYQPLAQRYFQPAVTRAHSRRFYAALLHAAQHADPAEAERVTQLAMAESLSTYEHDLGAEA